MLLAIDTSSRFVGIALYNGIQVVSDVVWSTKDYHTVELAPAVERTLARVDLKFSDLKILAIATGPGSYTGLRIGLAFVKGLSLAGQLPVIGIRTFDILAAAQPMLDMQMVTVLRAGRGRLAAGWYRPRKGEWLPTDKLEVITPEELSSKITSPTYICGELSSEERRLLGRKRKKVTLASPARSVRHPSNLAELAWKRWRTKQVDDPFTLAPVYLHYNNPIPG